MVKGRQGERVRLYTRGTVLGYKRSKSNQYPNTSLIQIEGVNTKEEVDWYLGKRMAYIYKAKTKKNNSHYRCIWGKVCRPHGNSGVVRAKFKSNLPPKSMIKFHLGVLDLDVALYSGKSTAITEASSDEEKPYYKHWDRSNRLGLMFMRMNIAGNVKTTLPKA
ncbi:60S ribosomal protein L35a-3 [Capsicum chinense]|nr:60S ribosomal protein L35a-3 [Capsicum chinense]